MAKNLYHIKIRISLILLERIIRRVSDETPTYALVVQSLLKNPIQEDVYYNKNQTKDVACISIYRSDRIILKDIQKKHKLKTVNETIWRLL